MDVKLDVQSNSDVDSKEDDSKVSDTNKNDYNWKLKLYLNCPITLRRKKAGKTYKIAKVPKKKVTAMSKINLTTKSKENK